VLPLLWVALVLAATILTLVFQGAALYLAAQMPQVRPGEGELRLPAPSVSVVIAARNEEVELAPCLDTLLAQNYPAYDVSVVDGGSTDGTRAVAERRAPRARLIAEPPLPPGWVGKSWACHVGAMATTGEYILFSDADVRYHPDAIRRTVAWAQAEGAHLATLAPRIEMRSFWEKVILPFYTQAVLTYFRAPRVNRSDSTAAMANGQYTLVRRDAYQAAGGHEAVRGYVLEDVRLAQEFRRRGFRLRVGWAPDLISTRMYHDRHEMFEGLLKNVHGTRFSALRQVGFLAALIGFFWLPLLVLPLGVWTATPVLAAVGAFLWFALFGKHVGFTRAVRGPAAYGLLFPLAVGFYVVLVGTSLVRGLAGRPLEWKGRAYPLDAGGGEPVKS
jgi:chlorobactene glucosyltransferase